MKKMSKKRDKKRKLKRQDKRWQTKAAGDETCEKGRSTLIRQLEVMSLLMRRRSSNGGEEEKRGDKER